MNRRLQALRIFEQSLAVSTEERSEYLRRECADDNGLLAEVQNLLSTLNEANEFLPTKAADDPVESSLASDTHSADFKRLKSGQILLDRYEIVESVGVGGMGEVYRALDSTLDRHVAIKLLTVASQSSEEMVTRFEREMRSIAALSHPNIVTFYDTANEGDMRFAVMEFIVGDTLRELIQSRLSWQETVPIIRDIAAGLHAAHDHGIIHRDIKPENVMITPNGIAKILDFGIARSAASQQELTLTATAITPGTIPYMSPEQIAGRELSFATDIFSLGTVIYEMLTGENPFRAENAYGTMERVTHHKPRELSEIANEIPSALTKLVMLMLDKKPLDRPTAKEVDEELSSQIAGTQSRLAARSHRERRRQTIDHCTTSDGVRIAYGITGEGPPFVKAANWMTHLEFEWDSPLWRPWISELSKTHQLIRYDERGNGLSDREVDDLSFEMMVADLEAVVDELGLERFPLFGISQGCPVSIEYAVRHPERVTHLILFNGYARGWLRAAADSDEVLDCINATKTLMRANWGANNPSFRQMFTSQLFPKASSELMTWFNDLQLHSVSAENACRLYEVFCTIDVSERLPLVRTPTLVLSSVRETFCDPDLGRELAEVIPGAEFVALDSENHLLLEDEPAFSIFMHKVRRFLSHDTEPDR